MITALPEVRCYTDTYEQNLQWATPWVSESYCTGESMKTDPPMAICRDVRIAWRWAGVPESIWLATLLTMAVGVMGVVAHSGALMS